MSDKTKERLDRVTQLDSRNLPMISGLCVINGIERPVAAFEVSNEVSRGGLEKALLKQAIKEYGE